MLDREKDFKLAILEIKRLKQLKIVIGLEEIMEELYEIEEELNSKMDRVKILEERALKEIMNQLSKIEETDYNINLLMNNYLKNPIETLIEIK